MNLAEASSLQAMFQLVVVGSHHAFVNSAAKQRDDQVDIVMEGLVHLNSAIAERSGLSSHAWLFPI
jgi:hypothetical protein